jgi:nucleoside-diphosphate-sugar epimerase
MNIYESETYLRDLERAADNSVHLDRLKGKSVLVTGATGTIGSFLVDVLLHYNRTHHAGLRVCASGEVYGQMDPDLDEFEENDWGYVDSTSPRSCYPASKRAAENLCASYSQQYGLETVIVRPCHTYGPTITDSDSRATAQFFRNALHGEDIVMKSAGTQLRSYCYVADCASAIMTVLTCGESGQAYNSANPEDKITIAGLAETIAKAAGRTVIFAEPDAVDLAQRTPITKQVLSSKKLEALGWRGRYSTKEGVEHTLRILNGK